MEADRLSHRFPVLYHMAEDESWQVFSGSPRGSYTFLRIVDHPNNRPVVQLAVDYAVPDAADLILSVSRWQGTQMLDEVWGGAS